MDACGPAGREVTIAAIAEQSQFRPPSVEWAL
jgi:hypothetical protein